MGNETSAPAREALMEAAERLYANRGIDHVSIREILNEAGQKNQSALQYHFGDQGGLLWAIFDRRMAIVEARRNAILKAAPPPGEEPARLLIEAIVRPLAAASIEDEGGHLFLKLAMQTAYRPDTDMLGIIDSGRYPVVKKISERLDHHLLHLPPVERAVRKRLIVEGCVGAVWIWAQSAHRESSMDLFVSNVVAMFEQCVAMPSQVQGTGDGISEHTLKVVE